jgi:hypothetical protein
MPEHCCVSGESIVLNKIWGNKKIEPTDPMRATLNGFCLF